MRDRFTQGSSLVVNLALRRRSRECRRQTLGSGLNPTSGTQFRPSSQFLTLQSSPPSSTLLHLFNISTVSIEVPVSASSILGLRMGSTKARSRVAHRSQARSVAGRGNFQVIFLTRRCDFNHVTRFGNPRLSRQFEWLWLRSRCEFVTTITFHSDSIYGPNDPALAS